MPANDVRAFLQSFERLGYNVASVIAGAELRDEELNDPDAHISCETLGAVVMCAQRQRFTPNLGFELAKVTPLGAYPLIDYLVATSDTVGDGIRQLARYYQLVGNPVALELREEDDPIRLEMPVSAAPFAVEFCSSLIILHLRNETEGSFSVMSVSLMHRPDDAAALERALGCPVRALAEWNSIEVSRDAWSVPLRRRDTTLRQLLETQANGILARLSPRTGLAFEVQRALAKRMKGGDSAIHSVARDLAISPRTLQRRLAQEGAVYQELRDDARREAASHYICESVLTINEIAYLVGYTEPGPFYRAFKRWFGVTPDAFRQNRRKGTGRRGVSAG